MNLHLNKQLFRQAIQATSDQMQILPIYIEKDYWVTFALYTIFHDEIGKDTIFKGGTSLSKCYNMIERFSEDIDLVVLRRAGETDNKLKTKLKAIGKVLEPVLPEINIDTITHKMGMNRKTAHTYNKEFQGEYGQVRDAIIVESTWLGYFEPFTTRTLNSFIANMMLQNGQGAIIQEYNLQPFEVSVLEPTRTICEKIMSLVRFSYTENPIEDLKQKVRHCYDLHQLLKQEEFLTFFHSPAFDEMLLKVANDDVASFRNNNSWLNNHPSKALIFRDLENVWPELVPIYSTEFKNLVYGQFPNQSEIFQTLNLIKERLTNIKWSINCNI
jgi:Nucleotidyl transferase AbiEii toxin, Type IV TA system